MITKFWVKGFKTLRDVQVPLADVTILVGPNNCGKSNFVKALQLLGETARTGSIEQAVARFGGLESVCTRGGDGTLELGVTATFGASTFEYSVGPASGRYPKGLEHLRVTGEHNGSVTRLDSGKMGCIWEQKTLVGDPGVGLKGNGGHPNAPPSYKRFFSFLSGMAMADFSIAELRASSQISPDARLDELGRNLAAVLDRLDGEQPLVRERINEEVQRAIPGVKRVVTIPAQIAGHKVVGVSEGANVFRAEHVSDGVLLFIALTTVSQMSGGKTLVTVEEPEKGIHPRRIRETLDQILRVVQTGTQFVLTSHSPVLLSEFRDYPEKVLILDRDEGGTRVRQLSTLPDVEQQLRDVSLGELWFSGVLGGTPKPGR